MRRLQGRIHLHRARSTVLHLEGLYRSKALQALPRGQEAGQAVTGQLVVSVIKSLFDPILCSEKGETPWPKKQVAPSGARSKARSSSSRATITSRLSSRAEPFALRARSGLAWAGIEAACSMKTTGRR